MKLNDIGILKGFDVLGFAKIKANGFKVKMTFTGITIGKIGIGIIVKSKVKE